MQTWLVRETITHNQHHTTNTTVCMLIILVSGCHIIPQNGFWYGCRRILLPTLLPTWNSLLHGWVWIPALPTPMYACAAWIDPNWFVMHCAHKLCCSIHKRDTILNKQVLQVHSYQIPYIAHASDATERALRNFLSFHNQRLFSMLRRKSMGALADRLQDVWGLRG